MLAQPHLVSLIVDRAGTAWDLAKLTGGGPEPNGSARHKLRRLFETKRNWWSLVPSEFWGTAALLLDQAIGASAERGFFSTSKFCGPAGFRRSTFSEAIALRWQQRRRGAPAPPLCAHALERALLQGRAARGEYVY